MIGFRLQSKNLDELRAKAATIGQEDELGLVGGRAAANLTKDHLFALDTRVNQLGGPRTHFYSSAAKSVSQVQKRGGVVAFDVTKLGLTQRWLGGTITAGKGISSASGGPTKYLTIPARAETYNVPPSAFSDLKFVPRRGGGAMLVQALQTTVSIGKKAVARGIQLGGLVMYWLVKSVTQKPDPSVMPTEEELLNTASTAMGQYLSRRLAS